MATGVAAAAPPPESVEVGNLRSLLSTTRTLTWIWALIGLLVAILSLLSILVTLVTLRFPGGGIGSLVYAILWIVIDLLLLERMPSWNSQLGTGSYHDLKEPLLLWALLGLIFGVVPGVLLILVYLRILPWPNYRGAVAGPSVPSAIPPPGGPTPVPPPGASGEAFHSTGPPGSA